jgi:MYXO-CTERM domain-containing protein
MKKIFSIIAIVIITLVANTAFADEPYCKVTKDGDDITPYTLRYIMESVANAYLFGGCSINDEGLNFPEADFADNMVLFQTQEQLDLVESSATPVKTIKFEYKASVQGGVPSQMTFDTQETFVIGNISEAAVADKPDLYDEDHVVWDTMQGNGSANQGFVVVDARDTGEVMPFNCSSTSKAVYLRSMIVHTNGISKSSFFEQGTCLADAGAVFVCNSSAALKKSANNFDPSSETNMLDWCDCNEKVTVYRDKDGDGYYPEDGSSDPEDGPGPGIAGGPGSKLDSLNNAPWNQAPSPQADLVEHPVSLSSTVARKAPITLNSSTFGKKKTAPQTMFLIDTTQTEVTLCADDDDVQGYKDEGYDEAGDDCDDSDVNTYPGAAELCDGKDNDCDGVIPDNELDLDGDGVMECAGDCDDNDASSYPGAEEICEDGIDQDCNGVDLDCDEEQEICDDGIDNDEDGDTDCDDSDCDGVEACEEVDDEICDDGIDNDEDGDTDCDDTDCDGNEACEEVDDEICDDGIDNDADGDTDCDDSDCDDDEACKEVSEPEICNDGLDNDLDGLTDCDDTDCESWYECNGLGPEEQCNDDIDNDADGFTDCDDADCAFSEASCSSEVCDDLVDNDGDGLVDCEDSECSDFIVDEETGTTCATLQIIEIDDGLFLTGGGGCGCDLTATKPASMTQFTPAAIALMLLALIGMLRRRKSKQI